MDNQELLTRPASTLTRKQRKERAALKKSIAQELKLPPGRALGRFRIPHPPLDTSGLTSRMMERAAAQAQAVGQGRLGPGVHVIVRDSPFIEEARG